ncbi:MULTISPECIES: flotillin family protein [Acinetobacter]|uniref:Flotillin family protein n=1 Tax=Acinetobacter indicus TaxID=756892 RepID=A0AAW8YWX5_9GAMM|nr:MULTISPECIES: flotillin family protein [Acinetobacter]MCO8088397.1 flotillin family protein [Acinetobacter indicus]MCO8099477.1 flotillin family protein [Acinetobacter indicus]MCO8101926.1 flotillin family protein [Acinetobacter indicus]MCO8105066.1 flotillin family protein [Acinetobacter indicus]MCO8110740.1 flotillin family protein [Acinetobacter indicus]
MLSSNMYNILIIAGIIFLALFVIGLILARLYRRSSKEISFVRTGFGGEHVILGGGAIVLPVLHEIIPVNMNTLRLEVRRAEDQALITRDRMRVDVMAEFYVRVKPTAESIATAAQTLGQKTMSPNELKNLVEGKFVDSLRAVAAEMAMEELHEKRVDFVQKVQQVVSEDLFKNGLELETVSLTGLDQTSFRYFNPQNAFDAEGLTKLTETIEDRRRKRNDIEQDADLAIKAKNLEAEQARLQILREEEYAKLQQEREISVRRAEQLAEIAAQEAAKKREAEEARIAAEREIELKRIGSARDVANENILKEQLVQKAQVEQKKTIELAEQDRAIAIAEKSRAESEAKAQADLARAQAVKAEEEVITVRETQRAERAKAVELVAAKQAAEKDAIAITVAAEAGKQAAVDEAEAVRITAEANAEQLRLKARGEADAKVLLAQAMEKQYQVDAEGTRAVNEANNILSTEQVEMQVRLAMLKYLPEIIRESVKPMENIDDIKILHVNGLNGMGSAHVDGSEHGHGQVALSDQVVNSALRYRSQAPLIDSLMSELGIHGGDINGLTQSLKSQPKINQETSST